MYSAKEPEELKRIYQNRFQEDNLKLRGKVWDVLVSQFFQKYVKHNDVVLDLGCGYGEFINRIDCGAKFAMDLNPTSSDYVGSSVSLIRQDCSEHWDIEDNSLDVVFTSNFFEHLPDKLSLKKTILEAHRCLKKGGIIIALGPNIKYVPGKYWDFWDHYLCLTEQSLIEGMVNNGFAPYEVVNKFLPYTTIGKKSVSKLLIRLYLKMPLFWKFYGKQFMVIGQKV